MAEPAQEIAQLYAALDEVMARRYSFSEAAYEQVTQAIQEKIRRLQTEAPAPEHDEIRLVTIMFVDIVNSTHMTLSLSADDWKATVGTAHNQVATLIHKAGGVVGQYLGDGLLCFFGSTVSRDDDALRAVRCALDIQAVIARYGEEIYVKHDLEFSVRIGISTGRAVVGLFGGADNKTMLALGTPANLAARLQSAAHPGEILIDAQTYRLVSDHFLTEAYPATSIRGFEAPLYYYAVKAPRDQRSTQLTQPFIASFETDFVGREVEMAQISEILDQSLHAGRWATVTIYGEIGLGKSRLLQAILDATAYRSYEPLVIVGNYQRRSSAYSLLQDLLTTRCKLKDDMRREEIEQRIESYICETWPYDDAEAAAQVIGFLAGYGFANSPYVRPLQEGRSERTQIALATIARWFRAQAEAHPLLLVVDNLHWLDSSSLRLLEYLASDLADLPGAILAAARPLLHEHYPQYMQNVPQHVEIQLARLSDSQIDRIISAVFEQVTEVPEHLPALIRQRAEGNPLFVEEFIYMLLDHGIIELDDSGNWHINRLQYSIRSSGLPDGLLALLQTRLDELEMTARQVVQIAATVGSSFWASAIAELLNPADVARALADLEARGMIVSETESDFEGEIAYRFRHTLYRDVIYSMLTRQNRALYHRNTARWLAERVENHPEFLDVLAEHYLKGGQNDKSLFTYCAAAADRYERGLMSDTLMIIERGLNAAREVPRTLALPQVSFLWGLQAKALIALDRYEEASAASQTALMLLNELPDEAVQDQKAGAARTLGHAQLSLGRYTEAFNALNLAHSLLPEGSLAEHAALMRTFGRLFQARGQLNESLVYQQQAFTLAQASGDKRELSRVMALLSIIAVERGDFATALIYSEQVLERNQEDENTYYQILDLRQLAYIYLSLFAYEEALALCDEADLLQARIHYEDPRLQSIRALSLLATGQLEQGFNVLQNVAQIERQNTETQQSIQLAFVAGLAMIGDDEECYTQAGRLLEMAGDHNMLLYGRGLMWQGMARTSMHKPAESILQQALNYELTYGGRLAWLCYRSLGQASNNQETAHHWYGRALNTLEAIATSLYARPKLQETLLNNRQVQLLRKSAPVETQKPD